MADIAVETKTYEEPKVAPVTQPEPVKIEPAKEETTAPEPEKAAPVEPEAAVTAESEQTPPGQVEEPEGEGQQKKDKGATPAWFQKRINQLTRQKGDLERERLQLQAELEAAKKTAPKDEGGEPTREPSQSVTTGPQPTIQELVQMEAQRLREAEKFRDSVNTVMKDGHAKYDDFDTRCNFLADLGATENPAFMATIVDLEGGHDIIAKLSEEPEEAQRIFALPPVKLAAELGRMSAKLTTPAAAPKKETKPISSAPPPIKTIDGSAKPTTAPSSDDNDADWFAKRMRQREEKKLGRGARF